MSLLGIFQSRGNKFYRWFENAAENNYKAALLLEELCKNFKNPKKISDQIHSLEHNGDQITQDIHSEINSVFVTPLDREDIVSLTGALDDVIDSIYASSSVIATYNVKHITPIAKQFSEITASSAKVVFETLPKLQHRRNFSQVRKAIIEINRLENLADGLLRKGLEELFKNPKDAINVIRWRDIYGIMEDTTNKTEIIAHVLQNLITKYA